jgi:hypothetical protein
MTQSTHIRGIVFVCFTLATLLFVPALSHAETNVVATTKPVKDLSCVQSAVVEREATIAASWTTFNTAMVAALTARTEALTAAWGETDTSDRAADLKAIGKTWKEASKKAHAEMKTDRKDAWKEFKATLKSECKVTKLPKEDAEPMDMKGAVAI